MSATLAIERFLADLGPGGAATLRSVQQSALQSPPADWIPWYLAGGPDTLPMRLGILSPERAAMVGAELPGCVWANTHGQRALHWLAAHHPAAERSALLQQALERWNLRGLVHGWRGEPFAFWTHSTVQPPTDTLPLFQAERAGFRHLGIPSHAVHINGFTPQGLLWCGRRALSKATDPGKLDNVTAGGLPAGETPWSCALRELQEEAGATVTAPSRLMFAGTVRTARQDPTGWHEETLLVYNWICPDGWTPLNQDGEVAEFMCLAAGDVAQRIAAGDFTVDAAASLAHGLRLTHEGATIGR